MLFNDKQGLDFINSLELKMPKFMFHYFTNVIKIY